MVEITYLLFLFSGLIKGVLLGFGFNLGIDFTLLTAFLTLVALSHSIFIKNKISWPHFKSLSLKLVPFALFYIWCVYTLTYDSSGYLYFKDTGNTFAHKKIVYFLTCYIALIIPLYHLKFNIYLFKKHFINLSLLFGFFYLIVTPASLFWQYGQTEKFERFLVIMVDSFANSYIFNNTNSFNFNYSIFAGSNLAISFNLAISLLLILSNKVTFKSSILFSFCFILIFATGGRSPIIFVILLLLGYLMWNVLLQLKNKLNFTATIIARLKNVAAYKYIILLAINIGFVIIIVCNPVLNILYKKSIYRFAGMSHYIDDRTNLSKSHLIRNEKGELISVDQLNDFIKKGGGKIDTSILMREMLIKSSFQLITNDVPHFTFGYGFGTFGKVCKYALKNDDLPHNFLLEVFVETGFVGILLLLFALFPLLKILKKENIFWTFTILFIVLNALKSTPLVDRNMFGFFAITLYVCGAKLAAFNKTN